MSHLSPRYAPDVQADVCLLLEGTFPYVRGGVSSWVRQIIQGMPELRFSIIYLGADPSTHPEPAYELPDNLVHIEVHFLLKKQVESNDSQRTASAGRNHVFKRMAGQAAAALKRRQNHREKGFATNDRLHADMRAVEQVIDPSVINDFYTLLCGPSRLNNEDLETDPRSWNSIREQYRQAPEGLDFNHYFWSVRSMHAPLFTLADIARQSPKVPVLHAISTGYAGFLGALMKQQSDAAFLISEHGIYTKERELDLAQVDWIPESFDPFQVGLSDNMGHLRSLWVRFFRSLGRMAYSTADDVFTLYTGNRHRQILDGANPESLHIIPNGVDVARYRKVRHEAGAPIPQTVALIGRVVPIKDIKTFIRAMQIVRARLPVVRGLLYGPVDEDVAYAEECHKLIDNLGLSQTISFEGFAAPDTIFPRAGLTLLSSVSEGQPLVILEGFAAGVPAVSTDVGSCRELIEGGEAAEDRALGLAGRVVPIANAQALADAVIELLSDEVQWRQAQASAIARVERYYSDVDMLQRYRSVYSHYIESVASQCPRARRA